MSPLQYKDSPNVSAEFRAIVKRRSEKADKELSEEQSAIDSCSDAETPEEFFELLFGLNPRIQMALIEVAATCTPDCHKESYLRRLSDMPIHEALKELSGWDKSLAKTFAYAWATQERQFISLGLPSSAQAEFRAISEEAEKQKAITAEVNKSKREPFARRLVGAIEAFTKRLMGEDE